MSPNFTPPSFVDPLCSIFRNQTRPSLMHALFWRVAPRPAARRAKRLERGCFGEREAVERRHPPSEPCAAIATTSVRSTRAGPPSARSARGVCLLILMRDRGSSCHGARRRRSHRRAPWRLRTPALDGPCDLTPRKGTRPRGSVLVFSQDLVTAPSLP